MHNIIIQIQEQMHRINFLSLTLISITDLSPPCTLSYKRPCTQLWTLLGLFALSCRASSYYYDPIHFRSNSNLDPCLCYSIYHRIPLQLRASLYLYNAMVPRPWVGQHNFTLNYNILGWTTLWLILDFTLCTCNSQSLTISLTKTWALSPKNMPQGIPCPTGPQHNHRDSSQVTLLVRWSWHEAPPTVPVLCKGPQCIVLTSAGFAPFPLLNPLRLTRVSSLVPASGAYVYSHTPLSGSSGHEDYASAN